MLELYLESRRQEAAGNYVPYVQRFARWWLSTTFGQSLAAFHRRVQEENRKR